MPHVKMDTVFDVGSNVGYFTREFGLKYPDARFYLFEPSPTIFRGIRDILNLTPQHRLLERSKLFQIALGHTDGVAKFINRERATTNKIVSADFNTASLPVIEVKVTTGDGVCATEGVDHIDYLKIDAEGYDMNVLIGFKEMLSRAAIDFIQVEAGMSTDNKEHISEASFSGFLEVFGFKLFRYINQASPWNMAYLTRADIVYIHESAIKKYTIP